MQLGHAPVPVIVKRMNIEIVSCLFNPEPVISARTSTDVAKQLARHGHRIRVITTYPNRPTGKLFEGYKRRLWSYDRSFADFEVLRLFSVISSESKVLSRFLENISFGMIAAAAVLFLEKPDVVYGVTWPIFAQGLLALVCRIRGIPLVLSVQDIYPESLSVQSRIGNRSGWLFRLLRWIDLKTMRASTAVVVISEKFRQIYVQDRGIAPHKVHVIRNWIDEGQVQIHPSENHVRCSHNIPEDAFLVIYAGNVGAACGLDTVIRAFRDLAADRNIYLLVAGSGSMLFDWRALAGEIANPRVLFHTPWLTAETSSVLAAASLFILPTYGNQSLVSVPSKLITYMLAGRPVLCCATDDSDIAQTIGSASCGWVIPAGDPALISRKLRTLSQRPPDELRRLGDSGRSYALRYMTRAANLPRLVDLIQSVG